MNILNRLIRYSRRMLKNRSSRNITELVCSSSYREKTIFYYIDKPAFIENKLIEEGIHSKDVLDLINQFMKPNTIFIDVGANIGTISQPIGALWKKSNVLVHSFEASNDIYNSLKANIMLNNLENITAHNLAITDFNGSLTFNEVSSNSKNRGLSSILDNSDLQDSFKTEVEAKKLDSMSDQFSLPISVIKIDVQGAELSVIKGALSLIKKNKPIIVFEHEDRYHQDTKKIKKELEDIFNSLSYKVFKFNEDKETVLYREDFNGYVESNLIAIPINK